MPKYKVELEYRNPYVVLEAENEDDALDQAQELIDDETEFNGYNWNSANIVELADNTPSSYMNEVDY